MSRGNIASELLNGIGLLEGSASRDEASITNAEAEQVSITVTGAALGDYVLSVGYSIDAANITITGDVTAANTVTANFINRTGGDITLEEGTVRAIVLDRSEA